MQELIITEGESAVSNCGRKPAVKKTVTKQKSIPPSVTLDKKLFSKPLRITTPDERR